MCFPSRAAPLPYQISTITHSSTTAFTAAAFTAISSTATATTASTDAAIIIIIVASTTTADAAEIKIRFRLRLALGDQEEGFLFSISFYSAQIKNFDGFKDIVLMRAVLAVRRARRIPRLFQAGNCAPRGDEMPMRKTAQLFRRTVYFYT